MSENSYPYAKEVHEGFDLESDYVEWLDELFKRMGWSTRLEVKSISGGSRADMIVSHDLWGTYGLECKNQSTPRNCGEAIKQIRRYKKENFPGGVDAWAVSMAPSPGRLQSDEDYNKYKIRFERKYCRELLNVLDIGVLRHDRKIEIILNHNTPMVKIPIANICYEDGSTEAPSLERLEECKSYPISDYIDDY